MSTKEELQALDSKQLNEKLDALTEELGEKLPKSGTNDDKVERIITAQEMLELKRNETGDDSGDQPDPDTGANPDQAESNPDPIQEEGNRYHVSAVPKAGFFRCNMFFPHEGVEVELSDEQLARIKAEKNLVIKD